MTDFNIYVNEFTGSVPTELGLMQKITASFDIETNDLTGTLPTQLGQLMLADSVYVRQNLLEGTVPSELGQLTTAELVWAGYNELASSLPSQLGDLEAVGNLAFYSSLVTGRIPSEFGRLVGLESIWLAYTELCSDVPSEVQALSSDVSVWQVTSANSIGTVCGWDGTYMEDTRFPTITGSTSTTEIVDDTVRPWLWVRAGLGLNDDDGSLNSTPPNDPPRPSPPYRTTLSRARSRPSSG